MISKMISKFKKDMEYLPYRKLVIRETAKIIFLAISIYVFFNIDKLFPLV